MVKLKVIEGRNALRSMIRARFLDFMTAITDEEEESTLKAIMAIDDRLSHRGTLHVINKEEPTATVVAADD